MTGILPIKKYKTQSALNNFIEYSMVQPRKLDRFFGFTKSEVQALCERHNMDSDEMERWYDGYQIGRESSVFNPNSVIQAVYSGECDSYWASTGAYENVNEYIKLNFDGLKDDIISMLAGGRCKVNTTSFLNDLTIINNKDDVFTVLIHLGYLAFDKTNKECYIPNKEVGDEMVNAVNASDWTILSDALESSEKLLLATLKGDEQAVAAAIDRAHDENTSILSYNDENSLSCVLSIAYYYARNEYVIHRELASGKGFADIVLIPRKHISKPAIVIELKYNKNVDSAIKQIKAKGYGSVLKDYVGEVLLVGITYNKTTKRHSCSIERLN
ncbi:MAG: AAA family ATPase, partial [Prevotella sp.]